MPTLIDTPRAFRRRREEGGFSDAQAGAIVDIFTDVDEQVATKGDIDRLDSKIESLEDRMDQRFEAVDQRFEAFKEQMDQRFEAVEGRIGKQIQEVRNSIVTSVAAVGAVLAVVIPLSLYFVG